MEKLKKKQKNGFTLVELLAVIVILAIILVIAVPKVMSVIEDAKKATLESTAKMIASQAEKQKVQNTVLGSNKNITCKDITNINDVDYEDCDIVFDNNTAKVTITGSGKFEGLYVCNGTKTSAVATDEECETSGGNVVTGASFLEGLLANEETLNNGLVQTYATYNGITYDAGIRYVGAMSEVKNKVYYNCDDTDTNGVSYGENNYDYASSCEVWRIIGVFNTKSSTSGSVQKRVKLINTASTFKASWDSSASGVNLGWGINQWGESGEYKGANLKQLLNGFYISVENSECKYCNDGSQETCTNICDANSLKNANMKILTNTAKGMIGNAVWDTFGVHSDLYLVTSSNASSAYLQEKGISAQNTGKNLCVEANGSEYAYCNDRIERTTSWTGLVGLMSVSDVTYADGWLYNQSGTSLYPFLISPDVGDDSADIVWFASDGGANRTRVSIQRGVFASVYLNSDIQIIGGDGNTEPYKLK